MEWYACTCIVMDLRLLYTVHGNKNGNIHVFVSFYIIYLYVFYDFVIYIFWL